MSERNKRVIGELFVEVHLKFGTSNPLPLVLEATREALDDSGRGDLCRAAGDEEIEEVTTLLALIQGPQLCAEQLIEPVRSHGCGPLEPPRSHSELTFYGSEDREVLTGVDLDLQPHRDWGLPLGVHPIDEGDAPFLDSAPRKAKPWVERAPDRAEDAADRPSIDLHEIDVLGVASGRPNVELIERCPSAEGEESRDRGLGEYGEDGT